MEKNPKISFYKEGLKYRVQSLGLVVKWLSMVVKEEAKNCGALSFILCTDDHLAKKNIKYLKTSSLTDVIAFDYSKGVLVSGDVLLN